MDILPSEYQHIELSRNEKIFVRNIMASEQYGYLLLDTNPAMLPNESMHILVCKNGVLFLKFFDKMQDVSQFKLVISAALGAPGGWAMAATIPADIIQYYGYTLRATQKLLYLYGFPEIDTKLSNHEKD